MKVGLVLSGGGAKGAFQIGAEKYAREKAGYKWSVISGISVGALNGAMFAMEKYDQAETLWRQIGKSVFGKRLSKWRAVRALLLGKRSIMNMAPLRKLIEQEILIQEIGVDLHIGFVSLESGLYYSVSNKDDAQRIDIRKAILASIAMPIFMEPIEVSENCQFGVDGGLRNGSPIGPVMKSDVDEIIIINCNPRIAG